MTLWRLEWLRLTRTRRLLVLISVFGFFGFIGPLTARYLSTIIDRFGGDQIQVVASDAVPADGIAQFAGNVYPIGLLVAVVVAAGALTLDALPEMTIFLRTRVASTTWLVIPRFTVTAIATAASYLLGVGIAWYETTVLLGSPPVGSLLVGALLGILYFTFAVAVVAVVATRLGSVVGTVLASVVVLLALPIIGIAEAVGRWLPSHLVTAQVDLIKDGAADSYLGAVAVTLVATVLLLAGAVRQVAAREL
jgi:ABC-2 type transport system permease protein